MAKKQRSKGQGTLYKRTEGGPWIASWYDHTGRRRERSTRTTDRRAAERILSKHVADAALQREGVVDARTDQYSKAEAQPLGEHVAAYIQHCRDVGLAPQHIKEKQHHLNRPLEWSGVSRLSELTAEVMAAHMRALIETGRSPGTANYVLRTAKAFTAWCERTDRVRQNSLKWVKKLDDRADRRRVRRPLTDEELARLMSVAGQYGRKAWYLCAALAGLRRGDMQRLVWSDVDFDRSTITIRTGKAKRVDVVPMHPQLAQELKRCRDEAMALPGAKVFPQAVTNQTRQKDFLRAGLAREEAMLGEDGSPIMIGKGKWRRPKTRIVTEDEEGRVVDLHALRTMLGTNLARQGVAPQIAQKIMRHADYRTTQQHYTVLGLHDMARAINRLPGVERTDLVAVATGTGGLAEDHQQYPQQLGRKPARRGATILI